MRTIGRAGTWIGMLLASASAVGAAATAPSGMRYLVFDWQPDGSPRLIFDRAIPTAQWHASTPAPGGMSAVAVRADGERVIAEVSTATVLRVPADAHGQYHAHLQPRARSPFVVRAPLHDAARLELRDWDIVIPYVLGKPTAATPLDTLASSAQIRAGKLGHPGNRVDVLILGEGYTSAQRSRFDADVATFQQNFFAVSPYREYRNFVNVNALFVPSAQSGADHPRYRADCSGGAPSCCTDRDAQNDPAAGTSVNTAFDGTYCTANIHRLLTIDYGKVYAAASAVPDWDYLFVLVNDGVYGGSGGFISVASTGPGGDDIVTHEFGHSFTRLADEYSDPYPGFPACSDLAVAGAPSCEVNVTDELRGARLKWRHFVAPQTPLPTPPGSAATGLFEGARYLPRGMFRAQYQGCMMRSVTSNFCEVCKESYVLRLYDGGWGAPAGGIRLIEPGSAMPDPASTILAAASAGQVLRAQLLQPEHPLEVFWRVNGQRVAGVDVPQLALDGLALQAGINRIELHVADTNPAVRSAKAGHLSQQLSWQVEAGSATTLVNPMGLTGLWYEAATSGQGINLHFIDEHRFLLFFYGFERDGDRLWLIGDYAGTIAYGTPLHFDLTEARGGVFEHLNPAAITRPIWGSGQVRFVDCEHAELSLTGTDGSQTLPIVKLAGVARLACNVL